MKKTVTVTQVVEVVLDESKFTAEFIEEFRYYFFDFKTIEDHAKHLAEMEATGKTEGHYIEGYGDLRELGIELTVLELETEIE